MNIDVLCVGKLKEKYLRDAVDEYLKRLSKYCRINMIEVADEKTTDGQGFALDGKVKRIEGERLLKHLKDDAFKVSLEIEGKQLDSLELADKINRLGIEGVSRIQFIIGGSLGLDDEVTLKSDLGLSFSKMTFPHQLMRVILLEQIYRSYRIISNEPYHK